MKISEKQAQMMLQVLVDSLCIFGDYYPFKYQQEARRKLADIILAQQSDALKDLNDE